MASTIVSAHIEFENPPLAHVSEDTYFSEREDFEQYDHPEKKRLRGQFFTTTNPFANEAFVKWFKSIPGYMDHVILEPFAGSNNIVWMLRDLQIMNGWASFDIDVVDDEQNSAKDVVIQQRNTLLDYPSGHVIAITNPPYLAKNSATRRGLPYAGGAYDDVYKQALLMMLGNTPYVAAIIPESFITQNLFHNRLHSFVSLTCRMFDDTETPVCLAMFCPEKTSDDFEIWSGNRKVGNFQSLREHFTSPSQSFPWEFNSPHGNIGMNGVDGTKSANICFVAGDEIDVADVKSTSRAITRIHLDGLSKSQAAKVIKEANRILNKRRADTKDIFMTAFKGLRQDGKYRRRLDFKQARNILNIAMCNLQIIVSGD